MALDRRLQSALDAEAAGRAAAPDTCKLEGLLWGLAEAQASREKHALIGAIAGTVGDWARRGKNLTATEVLCVVEAALMNLGVRT